MTEARRGADLHLHTTCSDGCSSPAAVVAAACAAGLRAIAVTDHDTMAGVLPACAAAGSELEVVAGVELSAQAGNDEIHIVGLFLPATGSSLAEELQRYQERRRSRVEAICARLDALGCPLTVEEVLELAAGGAVGRVHVARALRRRGFVRSVGEAFDRYLGNHAPAHVPKDRPTPEQAIRLIHECGGLAVLAHPGLTRRDDVIPSLARVGLDALEVYSPAHTPEQIVHYLALAQQYALLISAGSDYHGNGKNETAIGSVRLLDEKLEALRERGQKWQAHLETG